jgi:hypothetical protein
MSPRTIVFSWLAALLVVVVTPIAAAQDNPADEAVRRDQLEIARAALDAHDHPRAIAALEAVTRIRPSPSVAGHLMLEYEAVGRRADALAQAELCYQGAMHDTGIPERDTILTACTEARARLTRQVGRVVLEVPMPPLEGLRVTVAGREVRSALWGLPYPVDPGRVVIEASLPGRAARRWQHTIAAGQIIHVPIAFGGGSAASRGPGPVPFVLIGLGAVVALGSIPFWVLRGGALSAWQATCPESTVDGRYGCTDLDAANRHLGALDTYTGLGIAAVSLGAGLLTVGIAAAAAGTRRAEPRVSASAVVLPGGGLLTAGLRF